MRLLSVVFALAIPSIVHAQSVAEPRTWTATPFVAISFGTPETLDNSLGIGGAVGYDLTSNLGFEGEIGHAFDIVTDTDLADFSLTNISFNALYHFDVLRVTPYATFGLGWERASLDLNDGETAETPDATSSTEIAFNFGGGIKYRLGEKLFARGDLRRFQANDQAPDHWRLYGGLTFLLRR